MQYRLKALEIARAELGVHEDPAGSNSGPRVNEYLRSAGLGPGYPWCMAFVNWCYRQAGFNIEHRNEASVGFFEEFARRNGWLVSAKEAAPGDIVCYRFNRDNWPDHVGIVETIGPGRLVAIEGNTAIGDDANGGKVMRRSRAVRNCKFARIPGGPPAPRKPREARYDVDGPKGGPILRNVTKKTLRERIGGYVDRFGSVKIRRRRGTR